MLEEQVLEERDPEMNKEEDIIMEDSMDQNLSYVAEDGEDKSKITSMRWNVYKKEKEELTNRQFLMSVPYLKGENIV